MPRAKKPPPNYYTYKRVGVVESQIAGGADMPKYQCHKWTDDGELEETYDIVYRNDVETSSCGCPAYRPCKHKKALHEYIQKGMPDEDLWGWKWDAVNGWQKNTEFEMKL